MRSLRFQILSRWAACVVFFLATQSLFVSARSLTVDPKGGGTHPKWRRDGKELFYLGADSKMMAVEVTTGAAFRAGIPRPLFETGVTNILVRYAVTRDGQRFLIPTPTGEASPTPATVVVNWTAGIKR